LLESGSVVKPEPAIGSHRRESRRQSPLPQLQIPCPLPSSCIAWHWLVKAVEGFSCCGVACPELGVGEPDVRVWICVAQISNLSEGLNDAGLHVGLLASSEAITCTVPLVGIFPVSGLDVRSVFKDNVRSPFRETLHPQHSAIC
jgi:hypothetical protein